MGPVLLGAIAAAGLLVAKRIMDNQGNSAQPGGGGGGGGSLSSFVPKNQTDGNVLELVSAGLYLIPDFTTVSAERDGHVVEIAACNDALRVGAADPSAPRQMVSHELAQALADAFGLVLPTTRMSDMAWLSVPPAQRLGPVTMPSDASMGTPAVMAEASRRIDAAMIGKGIPIGSFSRVCGKEWVTSEKLLEPEGTSTAGCAISPEGWPVANVRGPVVNGQQQRFAGTIAGANFGWQWSQGTSKTPGGLPCVQSVGRRHGVDHADYSQLVTFYLATCRIDGADRGIADVLLDPELAYLLSDEVVKGEACRVTRHPAFPLLVG